MTFNACIVLKTIFKTFSRHRNTFIGCLHVLKDVVINNSVHGLCRGVWHASTVKYSGTIYSHPGNNIFACLDFYKDYSPNGESEIKQALGIFYKK